MKTNYSVDEDPWNSTSLQPPARHEEFASGQQERQLKKNSLQRERSKANPTEKTDGPAFFFPQDELDYELDEEDAKETSNPPKNSEQSSSPRPDKVVIVASANMSRSTGPQPGAVAVQGPGRSGSGSESLTTSNNQEQAQLPDDDADDDMVGETLVSAFVVEEEGRDNDAIQEQERRIQMPVVAAVEVRETGRKTNLILVGIMVLLLAIVVAVVVAILQLKPDPDSGDDEQTLPVMTAEPTPSPTTPDPTLPPSTPPPVTIDQQVEALLALYESTDGKNSWAYSDNWNTTSDFCDWKGVQCTNGEVTRLELSENNLVGYIPTQIGNLRQLTQLDLEDNHLTRFIPTELGSLMQLTHLSLQLNSLTGFIPTQLGSLQQLTQLSLDQNLLTGSIPSQLGSLQQLTYLSLHSNSLTSAIPTQFGSLAQLDALYLHDNLFSGSMSSEICSLRTTTNGGSLRLLQVDCDSVLCACCTSCPQAEALFALYESTDGKNAWAYNDNWTTTSDVCDWKGVQCTNGEVTRLDLSENNLVGYIPTQLGSLTQLTQLDLEDNLLTGALPTELGRLTQLTFLHFWENSLTGSIPTELGSLTQLAWLQLEYNDLTGAIPTELGSLIQLTQLSLQGNSLTGFIPTQLGSLQQQLIRLLLDRNILTGSIPSQLGSLQLLTYLSLHSNSLTSAIPSQLGRLAQLDVLRLHENNLIGSMPSEICSLRTTNDGSLGSLWADCDSVLCACCTSCPQAEALFALYETANGRNWAHSDNWTTASDVCDWKGVQCTDGEVTRLDLSENNLMGYIPTQLGSLTHLTQLDLEYNHLSGTIPTELGRLTQLTILYFWENSLTGSIPTELGSLTQLAWLQLQYNALTGSVPTELGSLQQLTSLSLGGNLLTGFIPSQLGSLQQLTWLSLDGNTLTGSIPGQLGSLQQLTYLSMRGNSLTSAIPTQLGSLAQLEFLYLQDNNLSGSMPSEICGLRTTNGGSLWSLRVDCDSVLCACCTSCPQVEALFALYESTDGKNAWAYNDNWTTTSDVCNWKGVQCSTYGEVTRPELSENNLVGYIPTQIGIWTQLTRLHLEDNYLTGVIPTELGRLTQLTFLYVWENSLTGSIPTELGSLTQLVRLQLEYNALTGAIPTELGSLTQLTRLSLHWNRLTGSISTQLGSLQQLTQLSIDQNIFTGSIPSQLGSLQQLTYLSLYSNSLTSAIPTQFGSLAQLDVLYLNDNLLSGSMPSEICDLRRTNGGSLGLLSVDCDSVLCACCTSCPQHECASPALLVCFPGAYWKLEEDGEILPPRDSVGGFHGTTTNNLVSAQGKVAKGLEFDAWSGSYIMIGKNEASGEDINTLYSDGEFSILMWIKWEGSDGDPPNPIEVLFADWISSTSIHFNLKSSSNGMGPRTAKMELHTNGGYRVNSNSEIPLNEWYHVGVSVTNSLATFYVNGNADGGGFVGSSFESNGNNDKSIGGKFDSFCFDGILDEVAMYGCALSAEEVQYIYSTSMAGCPYPTN